MSFIAAAIIGAAGIGGALITSNSSRRASDAAQQTANQNNALQQQIYNTNTANIRPFMDRGNVAGGNLNALLGLGGDEEAARGALNDYMGSTAYDFQLNRGFDSITSNRAARGALDSGGTLKALENYRSGLSRSYLSDYLALLSQQQGVGISGANALAGVGTGYAAAVSANNNAAGDARANAALASGNAWNNALSGLGQLAGYSYGQSSYGGWEK